MRLVRIETKSNEMLLGSARNQLERERVSDLKKARGILVALGE